MEAPTTKVCTKCGVDKPLEEFATHPKGKFGRQARCRACVRVGDAARYASGGKPTAEDGCLVPTSCEAKGVKLCPSCARKRPDRIAAQSLRSRAAMADPEKRKKASEHMKSLHANEEFAAKRDARLAVARDEFMSDPDNVASLREKASATMHRLNENPDFRSAAGQRLKDLHADPEWSQRHRERSREMLTQLHSDPRFASECRERMLGMWQNAEFAKQMSSMMAAQRGDAQFNDKMLVGIAMYHERRRENEAYDVFMARMEAEAADFDPES